KLKPETTADLISRAACHLPPERSHARPQLIVDSGVENLNAAVDNELQRTAIQRVIAQIDITQSNSMIEAFWRSLKHNWLFLNELDSFQAVRRLVAFYVEQHNTVMPPSTFLRCPERRGRTPDEIFAGVACDVDEQLRSRGIEARKQRLIDNQSVSCSRCTDSS